MVARAGGAKGESSRDVTYLGVLYEIEVGGFPDRRFNMMLLD